MDILTQIDPRELKTYGPQKEVFHDEPEDAEFMSSIRTHGVMTALTVSQDMIILSGHRRARAAIASGLSKVPCLVKGYAADCQEALDTWMEGNRQRTLTPEQKARIAKVKLSLESKFASERKKANLQKTQQILERENLPVRENIGLSEKAGRARDVVASELGMSGKTLETSIKVVEAADAARESGDTETADDLIDTLNHKSVNAAAKKIRKTKPETIPEAADFPAEENVTEQESPEDTVGFPIPPHLLAVFEGADVFDDVLNTFRKLRAQINDLCSEKNSFFNGLANHSAIVKDLENARSRIYFSRPYAVCVACDGLREIDGKPCECCSGRGWINEQAYKFAPSELRR